MLPPCFRATVPLAACPPDVLRGVIDDAHIADMRVRNEARAKAKIVDMGPRYCCWNPTPPKPLQAAA